jgi:hypothetical protein
MLIFFGFHVVDFWRGINFFGTRPLLQVADLPFQGLCADAFRRFGITLAIVVFLWIPVPTTYYHKR